MSTLRTVPPYLAPFLLDLKPAAPETEADLLRLAEVEREHRGMGRRHHGRHRRRWASVRDYPADEDGRPRSALQRSVRAR